MRITLKDLRRAVSAKPQDSIAANSLGLAMVERGEPLISLDYLRRAIKLAPQQAEYHCDLARTLLTLNRHEEAVESYYAALSLVPMRANVYYELGLLYSKRPDCQDQSKAFFLRAIELSPGRFADYLELCRMYVKGCSAQEVIACVLNDTKHIGNMVSIYKAAAISLEEYGRFEEAKECFLKALAINPNEMEILLGLGYVNVALRDLNAAMKCYKQAYELHSSNLWALSMYFKHLFRVGLHQQAQNLLCSHEVRDIFRSRNLGLQNKHLDSKPEWDGSSLQGKAVLVYINGGYGDVIHFSRYATQLKNNGAKVIVQCAKPLHSLIGTLPGVDLVIDIYDECPPFDYTFQAEFAAPLIEWCWESLGRQVPYLFPPPNVRRAWHRKFTGGNDLKVGINWKSSTLASEDHYRFRSLSLEQLRPLTNIPGVKFYSLQVGPGAKELTSCENPFPAIDISADFHDFMDTAAAILELDLVITVDTAVAHLAGALGMPCWVMLPYFSCWRWMLCCTDSPWYQTIKLYRQAEPGGWSETVSQVAKSLNNLALSKASAVGSNIVSLSPYEFVRGA